jgi:hypothetical protein
LTPTAYFNSSKLCWEIWIEEAQGDRFVKVLKHANVAHKMLKEQGIKFVDANTKLSKKSLLLICDPNFWLDNEQDIVDWCVESSVQCRLTGMLLEFDCNEDKMMFMLRWQ